MHNYFLPPRIEFGDGTIQNLGEHVKAFDGKNPLLVSDAGVINAGILAKAIDALDAGGLSHTIYSDIEPNPTDISITEGVEAYKAEACDVVIAVGGGSVMDAAKAIRLLTTHEPPAGEVCNLGHVPPAGEVCNLAPYYADVGGLERIRDNMPPLICVPTTAGTGSEVSQGAIITDTSLQTTDRWRKRAIVTPFNMSNIALLDPGITLGMPPALTAATGMDAITHGIEAYVATKYHPIAEGVALQALRMLSSNIQKVYHDGSDVKARGEMLLGSCMAAFSFQKGLGAVHSLAHQLSTDAPIPHGVANAILLPPVMEFNFSHARERYAEVACALGIDTSDMDIDEAGHAAIDKIKAYNIELNMPTGLGAAGLDRKKITKLGADAMLDHCHKFNPRACTEEDMVALFEAAF